MTALPPNPFDRCAQPECGHLRSLHGAQGCESCPCLTYSGSTFKEGDRVKMWSACSQLSYGRTASNVGTSKLLRGTVEEWSSALVVRWDDWPLVTQLPNPNVELDPPSAPPSTPPEAA